MRSPLIALCLFVLSGCFSTSVTVPRLAPAEIDLAGYKRLAIGGISGDEGEQVAGEVTRAIFDSKRFEVLDRQNLRDLTREQDLAISGRVSDDSAVSIGQMIGSAALLVGDVGAQTYDEDVSSTVETCERNKKKVRCVDYTRNARAHLNVTLKVLDTETGRVLAARTLEAHDQKTSSQRDSQPAAFNAREEMLSALRRKIADEFAAVIAPHTVNETVELLDDGDLPDLERGNNYAKIGKWQEAINAYNTAIEAMEGKDISTKDQAKAYYDLGIGYGYSGQHDRGITELERAYSLDPSERTAGAMEKLKRLKADDAELAKQQANAN